MLWIIAIMLILLAGLNAPLALCALSLAAINNVVALRPDLAWIGSPLVFGVAIVLLAAQLLADLYFVPITVRDVLYLNPHRTHNNYLHARVQSLLRPLVAALLTGALPLPMIDWMSAVLGFSCATGCYWLSAWVREHVAVTRGALVLLFLETLKNAWLLVLAGLTFWFAPLALGLLLVLVLPVIAWTARLQREHIMYASIGGQRAGEDS